jgi:hypothetical protein
MDEAVDMLPVAVAEAAAPLVVLLVIMTLSFLPAEGIKFRGVMPACRGQKERTPTTLCLEWRNYTHRRQIVRSLEGYKDSLG